MKRRATIALRASPPAISAAGLLQQEGGGQSVGHQVEESAAMARRVIGMIADMADGPEAVAERGADRLGSIAEDLRCGGDDGLDPPCE